jgi:beta-lactamase regulating signal transducer with metallopeptidase domain
MSDIALRFLVANFAAGCAIILVLLLRKPVRASFGARIAYSLWLLAPLAAIGSLLPPRTVEISHPAPMVAPDIDAQLAPPQPEAAMALEVRPASALTQGAATGLSTAIDPWLIIVLVWLAGVIGTVVWQLRNQSRFMEDARAGFAGPAVVGFIRPRIVTPSDFNNRFNASEREVVLAHEAIHLDRNDARINAAAALVRCLCWFNPLFMSRPT